MTNGTVPTMLPDKGESDAAMTIRVYRVDRQGIVTEAPPATVVVPRPTKMLPLGLVSSSMPPCECPMHRMPGGARCVMSPPRDWAVSPHQAVRAGNGWGRPC